MNIEDIDWDNLSAGYCKGCREMEMSIYNTVLSYDLCEKMDISYMDAHTDCCEKANCKHPYWYPRFKKEK